jgi:hypothetical protein
MLVQQAIEAEQIVAGITPVLGDVDVVALESMG